jgi:hypothetical protein
VSRIGTTTAELAERMNELLRRLGTPVIGVALNCASIEGTPRGTYRKSSESTELTEHKSRHRPFSRTRGKHSGSDSDRGEDGSTKKVIA